MTTHVENEFSFPQTHFHLSHPSAPDTLTTPAVFACPSLPTSSAVILCHGFLSDKDSRTNRRLTELLIPRGIATLRFDWYGMGQSPAPFAQISIKQCIEQLDLAVSWLKEQDIHQIGLMGSSFGGLIALLSAPNHPTLSALALKCPVVDFPEVLRLEFGEKAMEEWRQHNHIPDILGGTTPVPLQFSFFEECLSFVGYPAAQKIHAPTIIVHGDQDELIPQHQIDRLYASLPNSKRLELLPGADHRFGRPEDFRLMTNHIGQWMLDHLPHAQ